MDTVEPKSKRTAVIFPRQRKMLNILGENLTLAMKRRGITQEINLLDIDGERVRGWSSVLDVPTLPEMLSALGKDGWEMVSHMVNQDGQANGVTFHYLYFKKPHHE